MSTGENVNVVDVGVTMVGPEVDAVMAVVVPAEAPEHHFVVPKPRVRLTPQGDVDPRRTAQNALMANWNM